MSPIQTVNEFKTIESKQTLPQHPYLHTQFSDDYNPPINIYF